MDKNVCLFGNGLLGLPPLKTTYLFVPRYPYAEDSLQAGTDREFQDPQKRPPHPWFDSGTRDRTT